MATFSSDEPSAAVMDPLGIAGVPMKLGLLEDTPADVEAAGDQGDGGEGEGGKNGPSQVWWGGMRCGVVGWDGVLFRHALGVGCACASCCSWGVRSLVARGFFFCMRTAGGGASGEGCDHVSSVRSCHAEAIPVRANTSTAVRLMIDVVALCARRRKA